MNSTRRDFARLAAGAAMATASAANAKTLEPLTPGIKLALQVPVDFTDEDLTFGKQMGLEWVSAPSGGGARATAANFIRIKQRVEAAGMKLWNIGNFNVHNMPEVVLNLPGREQKIAEYKTYLRNLAKAGITYTTYAHVGNGIWRSGPDRTRGGAEAQGFRKNKKQFGRWFNTVKDMEEPTPHVFEGPLTHGRKYSKEEMWENYTYFVRQVAPLAEELGIRIGIHPDDPPAAELGGVPRCIFGNFDGYVRALEIANSPNIGVCLCCGTWLEGGKQMGKDVVEAVRYFGKSGKLWKIHFRNVSAPMPDFVETFVDDGYMDMYKIAKALREVDFRGIVIADHVPAMVGGRLTGWAFSLGYIKALFDRAKAEVKA